MHYNYLGHIRKNGAISNTLIVSDKNSEATMIGFGYTNKVFLR
jgi:hypothetical protein